MKNRRKWNRNSLHFQMGVNLNVKYMEYDDKYIYAVFTFLLFSLLLLFCFQDILLAADNLQTFCLFDGSRIH